MQPRLLLLWFLLSSSVAAQESSYSTLAEEVCSCMMEITDQRPRGYARACLLRVTRDNFEMVEEILGRPIGENFHEDTAELLGHLMAYLAADCPFLQTLSARGQITKYRWSDGKRQQPVPILRSSPKLPVPTPQAGVLAEAPLVRQLDARIVKVTRLELTLSTEEGVETTLEVPPRLRNRRFFEVGEQVTLRYRLDWRIKEGKVVKVLAD